MPPLPFRLSRDIRLLHVKQLSQLEIPPPQDIPRELPPPYVLTDTLDWVHANPKALKAAQETQCSSASPDNPNWDAVFFSLVESSAMYLRKPGEMIKAIEAAREGDVKSALAHLEAAQEDINAVAEALDCTFIQLCDFSKQGPNGTWFHSGAFGGLFISNSADKPFMGVAFKGSNSARDLWTDADWNPIMPLTPGVAWGAKVHRGFYLGLFGQFTTLSDSAPTEVPFGACHSHYQSGPHAAHPPRGAHRACPQT
ncbi:hypothetical protein C8Q78DRAFT_984796 [Trametes maxima]|nr:hypothetical protein C8Q78DRAFT_984796 [Trametes maxima]